MQPNHTKLDIAQPAPYLIQVQGVISPTWLGHFDELTVSVQGEDGWALTTLTGCFQDQAALQGALQKLYSLGLVLIKVERMAPSAG